MAILEWSDTQPRVELTTAQEFEDALDRLALKGKPDHPTIVALYAHDHQLLIGLGLPQTLPLLILARILSMGFT
jgi:phage head maturation protease